MKNICAKLATFSIVVGSLWTMLSSCGSTYKQNANVMMINAAPDLSNVDYYLQGTPRQKYVPFGYNTDYYLATKNDYDPFTAEIKNSVTGASLLEISTNDLVDKEKYSLFIFGKGNKLTYQILSDANLTSAASDGAFVRFVNLSSDVDSASLFIYDTVAVVRGRRYLGYLADTTTNVAPFVGVPVKTRTNLTVYDAKTFELLSTIPIGFEAKGRYTVYLYGTRNGNGTQAMQVAFIKNN